MLPVRNPALINVTVAEQRVRNFSKISEVNWRLGLSKIKENLLPPRDFKYPYMMED